MDCDSSLGLPHVVDIVEYISLQFDNYLFPLTVAPSISKALLSEMSDRTGFRTRYLLGGLRIPLPLHHAPYFPSGHVWVITYALAFISHSRFLTKFFQIVHIVIFNIIDI